MDRILLKVSEAAAMCGIGRSKAYLLVASGEWPTVRIGRSVRVPLEELREWVRSKVGEARQDAGW